MNKYIKNRKVCTIFAILLFVIGLCVACTKPETKEEIIAFIDQYDEKDDTIKFDRVEWITYEDTKRIEELSIDPNFPNGYYIYNEKEEMESKALSENTAYLINDWQDLSKLKSITKSEFIEHMKEDAGLYNIIIENDRVIKIEEQYIP
jgi:hypothetical protein